MSPLHPGGLPGGRVGGGDAVEDAVAAAPRGPKTLDDVRRIADRIRSDIDRVGGVDRGGRELFE
ncbi:hypothetical protein GCM10022225_48110 [Plantactinospora mayteni]|uniref:Uncharacterized protein n=1 Tax=Plantactinospora mayteni TaxID=566021 RepID=A0ABQ4ESN5_9ACTN|nr:hypothetical protein Pma05_42510 [Plantactinospora mayteni]